MSNYVYISIETIGLEADKAKNYRNSRTKIDSKTKLRTLFHQYFNPQKERRNLRLWILEECNVDY